MSLENFPNECEDCKFFIKNPILCDEDFNKIGDFEESYCTELDEFIEDNFFSECNLKEVE